MRLPRNRNRSLLYTEIMVRHLSPKLIYTFLRIRKCRQIETTWCVWHARKVQSDSVYVFILPRRLRKIGSTCNMRLCPTTLFLLQNLGDNMRGTRTANNGNLTLSCSIAALRYAIDEVARDANVSLLATVIYRWKLSNHMWPTNLYISVYRTSPLHKFNDSPS